MEIKIVVDDRIVSLFRHKRMLASIVALAGLAAVSSDAGQPFSLPNPPFTPGSVISSTQINQNFGSIKDKLNEHESRISNLEGSRDFEFFFQNPGNYSLTVPLNAFHVEILAVGGGGGGGGGSSDCSGAPGGSAGISRAILPVNPGSMITMNIAQPGQGGSGTASDAATVTANNIPYSGAGASAGGTTVVSGNDANNKSFNLEATGGQAGKLTYSGQCNAPAGDPGSAWGGLSHSVADFGSIYGGGGQGGGFSSAGQPGGSGMVLLRFFP